MCHGALEIDGMTLDKYDVPWCACNRRYDSGEKSRSR